MPVCTAFALAVYYVCGLLRLWALITLMGVTGDTNKTCSFTIKCLGAGVMLLVTLILCECGAEASSSRQIFIKLLPS